MEFESDVAGQQILVETKVSFSLMSRVGFIFFSYMVLRIRTPVPKVFNVRESVCKN